MIFKLGLLSLGPCLLLIALLNAQPMQAHTQHYSYGDHQYSGEHWGYSQPQRPNMHHHGHGFHRGHGHGNNEFNERYPDQGPGPNFGAGSYGGGQFRGGPGYGNPRVGVAYDSNYGRQQPEAGYGGQQSGSGYGGQPGSGFGNPPRTGHGTFQPRPNNPDFDNERRQNPVQPRPQQGGQDTSEFTQQQSGNAGRAWQARPGANINDGHSFQQPDSNTFQPRPQTIGQDTLGIYNQQSGNTDNSWQTSPGANINDGHSFQQPDSNTFQPRPQTSGQDTLGIYNQQSGNTDNSWQTSPGANINGDHSFQQPDGSIFQPRPQTSTDFTPKQSGNAGSTWQPRPVVESNDSGEFQQPYDRKASPTFQPRPTGLGTTNEDKAENVKTIQLIPGQQQTTDVRNHSVGSTIQARPAANADGDIQSAVDDNIASIFNTNNFMSPKLEVQGSRDPKAQVQPTSIDGRNLLETLPHCPDGSELHSGRCRQKA